jgi:hypothetical protein
MLFETQVGYHAPHSNTFTLILNVIYRDTEGTEN